MRMMQRAGTIYDVGNLQGDPSLARGHRLVTIAAIAMFYPL